MFARSFFNLFLWLLICLTLVSGQDPKSKAQKLFAEAEELFNKNTPEARAEIRGSTKIVAGTLRRKQ